MSACACLSELEHLVLGISIPCDCPTGRLRTSLSGPSFIFRSCSSNSLIEMVSSFHFTKGSLFASRCCICCSRNVCCLQFVCWRLRHVSTSCFSPSTQLTQGQMLVVEDLLQLLPQEVPGSRFPPAFSAQQTCSKQLINDNSRHQRMQQQVGAV